MAKEGYHPEKTRKQKRPLTESEKLAWAKKQGLILARELKRLKRDDEKINWQELMNREVVI